MPTAGHQIGQNKDGSITLQYQPKEKGIHEMSLTHNDKATDGSPFRCVVDSVGGGFLTLYGEGLSQAASGSTAKFSVVGGSGADITVEGPSKVDVQKENAGAATNVSFVPMTPGEYFVNIKVKGKHVHGSPFSVKVTGEGRKRSQLSLTGTSELVLGGSNVDLAGMVGILNTPSGNSEHCLLKKMGDAGSLGIASFMPKSRGKYKVEVTQDGRKYAGSPFEVDVGDKQVACAARVKVTGALKEGQAGKWNDINLDISSAGFGALGVSIEGSHRSDMDSVDNKNKTYVVKYRPHEPGLYLVNIRFADDHVPGSPFMVNIGGQPSGRVRETVNKDIAPAGVTGSGSKCEFQLAIPGTDPLDMEAALTTPSGKTTLCEIMDLPGDLYDIKFTPAEEGVHTISLKHKGLHISGSPFQYTVGKAPAAGPHKVEIGGTGMEKGEVGIINKFNIYTREAGGGKLTVAIEGPSKAEMEVVDRGHGYTTVNYKVSKEGEYGIHVKYDEEHVPDSPSMVYIAPESGDAKKVTVHGIRDRGNDIGRPCTFNVNLNGARGDLKSHVDTPSGEEEDCFMQEMDQDYHAVRFLPKENGIYYVHIKFNEAHIPGSPFPILVGKLSSDPALVLANGDGLTKGESGKAAKFTVVTTNAGSGALNVVIEGPSKVAIMCQEVDEGYEFTYTPMAPGDYLITIKYCNITIAGCPTMAKITGQGPAGGTGRPSSIKEASSLVVETVEKKPGAVSKKKLHGDASKVVAKGNGLKKAFQNRAATFTIDPKDAGQGMLVVAIQTPSGNPMEELSYKKAPRGTSITVNYKTKEKGEHIMVIRWGLDDIPGSPFTISV
jgi:filamin